MAREQSATLSKTGAIVTKNAFLRTLPNVLFAFELFARVSRSSSRIDSASDGWHSIVRTRVARDRLIHPKRASELIVSEKEVRDAMAAVTYFSSAANESLQDRLSFLHREFAERNDPGKNDAGAPSGLPTPSTK